VETRSEPVLTVRIGEENVVRHRATSGVETLYRTRFDAIEVLGTLPTIVFGNAEDLRIK
jgi:hypothetical protein